MYKHFLLLLATASIFGSCGKEKPQNPESVFYFNGIEVKTRAFQAYSIDGKTRLRCSGNIVNGEYIALGIGFNFGLFPNHDSFQVRYNGENIDQCRVGFFWHDTQYLVSQNNNTNLYAFDHINGKAKYILEPTWFYCQIPDSTNNVLVQGNDSILLSGTFYESNDVVIR